MYLADIARRVGVCTKTVRRYLDQATPPQRKRHRRQTGVVEPYKPYLIQRWNEGCRDSRQLWREIAERGYRHGRANVERFAAQLRQR